ncbi:hypothetical protein H0H81_005681 [Sphagnurus paluster]|uniref:Uncharacterized protein n=1 Tax=Sphagnurus paluster TaxID=117069 RepID=A0A9P7G1R6_9AGAR|nr:hypothetical protein H0H81_005681 [Sphagnurus paluster]
MGFFSSRKAEDTESSLPTPFASNEKSVAHVIRSRFYGKNKGKEREEHNPLQSFAATGASPAQTLSSPGLSSSTHTRQPSPLSQSSNAARTAGPSILRIQGESKSLPSTPLRQTTQKTNMGPPPSPAPSRVSSASALRSKNSGLAATLPRRSTDNATVSLAQRLNELAVANSEGLLNDDEYRLLRQNLFERFATSTTVPTEAPVVPVARPHPRGTGAPQEGQTSRPHSNFEVDVNRSPSIRSKNSVTSGVTSFLRRATRRTPAGSTDYSDTSSIFSSASFASNIFKRGVTKKSSASSVRTTTSRNQADAISIISSRTGVGSQADHSPHNFSPNTTRSATNIRRLATPPSSFPSRIIGSETTPNRTSAFSPDLVDDERLQTASDIRQEILAVEAEARRLMDAFNGLEMTTLAKLQRQQGRMYESSTLPDGMWTLVPDGRSQKRVVIADSDVASLKSAASGGTRSVHSGRKGRPKGSLNPSVTLSSTATGSLQRQASTSSVGSLERKLGGRSHIPPVPAIPASFGNLGAGRISSASLVRSASHVTSNIASEDGQTSLESEMDDIRRRREEVSERYAARLEYLRAKLKGAQLHEKLARH